MKLRPEENELIGKWIVTNSSVIGDETCNRIDQVIGSLAEVARSDSGWTTLFLDHGDGRYWERTYPHSEWHGGGPPALHCVSKEYVRAKYGWLDETLKTVAERCEE